MSPQKQRRTFISYSRTNKEFALKLALELRSSGFDIWLDQLDIPTGARWDDEVERALEECEIFMVILTPASSMSDNVKDEIGYAIDAGKRILPILLENANVPLRLRRFQYVDFTNKSYEEGIETAEQLLRKLIEEPTIPGEQFSSVTGAQKAQNITPGEEKIEQIAAPRADADRKAEDDSVPVPGAASLPAVSDKVSVAYPPEKAKGVKKTMLSKPLMIGIGIGVLSIIVIGVVVVPRLFTQPDPSIVDNQPGAIPVSGDPACLVENSQPVEIYVENFTALTLDYYWIDFDCQQQHYGTLNAKETMTLSTYVSHTWQFYDNHTGNHFFDYVADGEDYLAISGEVSASGVTGLTVGYVSHDGGQFNQTGDNEWVESSFTSDDEIYFEEVGRDEWSVYLYDSSRNVSIQLDLWTREIIYDDNTGQEPFVLYAIAEVDQ